jgi:hypothetical protein
MERPPHHRRRWLALPAVATCVVALAGCGQAEERRDDPTAAVRDYLVDAAIDHNWLEACGYLTRAQQRVAARFGAGDCRNVVADATVTLGGKPLTTVYQVNNLAALESVDGDHARVRLSQGDASFDFELVRADRGERNQFGAPDSKWRIASGGLAVISSGGEQ